MNVYVLDISQIELATPLIVGGKGANLSKLVSMEGLHIPPGFCLTTAAYRYILEKNQTFHILLDKLSILKADDKAGIADISASIRKEIEQTPIPDHITEEIVSCLERMGSHHAYAVRSSATAEDLATASFAGQQDSYLNIIGKASILRHIVKCWASLFTDRAVTYRIQNGFDHRNVYLAVIVQQMVFPQAAGILFTANPINGNRNVSSIDAGFGLGESIVSGLVNADHYKVHTGELIEKRISTKKIATCPTPGGGTNEVQIDPELQTQQVLADEQIINLEQIGRKIEECFGCPQDIEWCLVEDTFYIVQSRPITNLFPIPEANDQDNHVYISVGHQQMMTDPMKPLGLSLWQLRAARPMYKAAGRLFVDVITNLGTLAGREALLDAMGQHDPLIKYALQTIIDRGNLIQLQSDDKKSPLPVKSNKGMPSADILAQIDDAPSIINDLIQLSETSVEGLKQNIRKKSGTELFDFILEDIEHSKKMTFDTQHLRVIVAAMNASSWINENMKEWLGEKNVADILSQSVPHNITSEMGLALLDVADVIRPYPKLVDYLQQVSDDHFMDQLLRFEGGKEAYKAIGEFLQKYGMRCTGEIDITRTRWSEKPSILLPLIISNIRNFEPGTAKLKFEQGRQQALNKQQSLMEQLRQLPGGDQKAIETKAMIDLLRNFAGYREYPKYDIVSRFFIYKLALLEEAEKLFRAQIISDRDDVYYLTFQEFRNLVETRQSHTKLIALRKEAFQTYQKLTPPRVITSDGEIIFGEYDRQHLPTDAIVGLAVSSGVIEGRARIILNMEDANLEKGDILITAYTDPSWTPLFVFIKGLVTEVGGLMTHGAVIAREYGLPAVVGVDHATSLIKDGQRIRVNGTEGYIQILV